jgi:hypothetical protein
VQHDGTLLVENAQVHLLGMQIDAAVEFVVLKIKPHRGSPVLSDG